MSSPTDNPESDDNQDPKSENEAWEAIVADLSGQVDLGPQFQPDPQPEEYDYIDAYFDEGYEPPEPPPISGPADAFTRFAWAGALGGPIVMFLSYALGLGGVVSVAGLVVAVAGFAFLISKRDKHEPPGEDFGDGAVV